METEIVWIVPPIVGIIDIDVTTFCLKTAFPEISAGLKLLYRKHWTNSKQSPKGDNNNNNNNNNNN